MTELAFFVPGEPVPKQSFHMPKGKGWGYTPPRVRHWQETVALYARQAMTGRDIIAGRVAVKLVFKLPHKRRVDLDNLSKCCLDGCNGIVWNDDRQTALLLVIKHEVGRTEWAGVEIHIIELAPGQAPEEVLRVL